MHSSRFKNSGLTVSTSALALMLVATPMAPDLHGGGLKSNAASAASASANSESHTAAGGGATNTTSRSVATADGTGASGTADGNAHAHAQGTSGNSADSTATSHGGAVGNDTAADTSVADIATSASFGSHGVSAAKLDLVNTGALPASSGLASAAAHDGGTSTSVSLQRSLSGAGEGHDHAP